MSSQIRLKLCKKYLELQVNRSELLQDFQLYVEELDASSRLGKDTFAIEFAKLVEKIIQSDLDHTNHNN